MGWGIFAKIKKGLKKAFPSIRSAINKVQEFIPKVKKAVEFSKPYLDKIDWNKNDSLKKTKKIIDKSDDLLDDLPSYLNTADDFISKINFDSNDEDVEPLEYAGKTFIPKFK